MSPSHPGRPIRKSEKSCIPPLHSSRRSGAEFRLTSGFPHKHLNEEIPLWENNKMECGWIDAAGQQWGAIWRYRNNSTNYYYERFQIMNSSRLLLQHHVRFICTSLFSTSRSALKIRAGSRSPRNLFRERSAVMKLDDL